jgi:hypothetical protein
MEEKPIVREDPFFILEVPNSHLTDKGRDIVIAYQLALQMKREGVYSLKNFHNAIDVRDLTKHPDLIFNIRDIADIVRPDMLKHYLHVMKVVDKANFAAPTEGGKFLFVKATPEQMREIVKNRPGGAKEAIAHWFDISAGKKLPTEK